MASQNRNDGSGLGNYELRFGNAGQAIGEARRKNRLFNWPIIVEVRETGELWLHLDLLVQLRC